VNPYTKKTLWDVYIDIQKKIKRFCVIWYVFFEYHDMLVYIFIYKLHFFVYTTTKKYYIYYR